jgi:hypothetical protein
MDEAADVRQSALALLGDLSRVGLLTTKVYVMFFFFILQKINTLDMLGLPNTFASTPSRIPYCCSKAIGKHIVMFIILVIIFRASYYYLLYIVLTNSNAAESSICKGGCFSGQQCLLGYRRVSNQG